MMKVNEIFYSLQGEGYHSGTPAVFVRFSGCNLRCPFCDTQHEEGIEMSEAEIVEAVKTYPASLVVVTGGEPAMQLTEGLVDALHAAGKYVSVETNGTLPLPKNVDWITLSPKDSWVGSQAAPVLSRADELKLLFDGTHEPSLYSHIAVAHRFLQPCDMGNDARNAEIMQAAVDYIKKNPAWRLSLQIHKILKIR